ncbi:atp-dependent rrna helicase spb4 [Gossypium arboreum]|uniref:Atp-dependent rrna helicase spb4 n=1 Tax=Gossypium arboreum TaxID=29729 RepID=A0A0B0PVQ8_GOSAR|nr:atp-dependent rrna helicase spb4 [Gossypium arboreum]
MPKSPQKWSFLNRTILGLDRDTPVRASILPNGHGRVDYTCEEVQAEIRSIEFTKSKEKSSINVISMG